MSQLAPLKVALLGAGTFASSTHLNILLPLIAANRVTITLVWSRRSAPAHTLSAEYPNNPPVYYQLPSHPTPYASVEDALRAHRETDAVIVALPPGPQKEFAKLARLLDFHVMLEKPLALDLPSARDLLRTSSAFEKGKVLALAENFRFEPALLRAAGLVRQSCGGVVTARLNVKSPMPEGSRYGRGWRLELDGPGILLDGCVHHFAGLRLVMDADICRVAAKCDRRAAWFKGADTVAGYAIMTSGVQVSVFVTYASSVPLWELEVVGKKADVMVRRDRNRAGYSVSVVSCGGENGQRVEETEHVPFGGLEAEFEAFLESCRSAKVHPRLDAMHGFNDIATVFALFQSSEEGREVTVEEIGDLLPQEEP